MGQQEQQRRQGIRGTARSHRNVVVVMLKEVVARGVVGALTVRLCAGMWSSVHRSWVLRPSRATACGRQRAKEHGTPYGACGPTTPPGPAEPALRLPVSPNIALVPYCLVPTRPFFALPWTTHPRHELALLVNEEGPRVVGGLWGRGRSNRLTQWCFTVSAHVPHCASRQLNDVGRAQCELPRACPPCGKQATPHPACAEAVLPHTLGPYAHRYFPQPVPVVSALANPEVVRRHVSPVEERDREAQGFRAVACTHKGRACLQCTQQLEVPHSESSVTLCM